MQHLPSFNTGVHGSVSLRVWHWGHVLSLHRVTEAPGDCELIPTMCSAANPSCVTLDRSLDPLTSFGNTHFGDLVCRVEAITH